MILTPQKVRGILDGIEPAAVGISAKTLSNLRSNLQAGLLFAGVVDPPPTGAAASSDAWSSLHEDIRHDLRLRNGLITFINFCATCAITPEMVSDETVADFAIWLETRTIRHDPGTTIAGVPRRWNEATSKIDCWPKHKLTPPPKQVDRSGMAWEDLPSPLREEIDAYLDARAKPDILDEDPDAPIRPLKESTLRQQRAHLKLAAAVLHRQGHEIDHLGDLVAPDAVKTALTYYLQEKGSTPAFLRGLNTTLLQVASMHLRVPEEQRTRLKQMMRRLPPEPADLTDKNMAWPLSGSSMMSGLYFVSLACHRS